MAKEYNIYYVKSDKDIRKNGMWLGVQQTIHKIPRSFKKEDAIIRAEKYSKSNPNKVVYVQEVTDTMLFRRGKKSLA